jgi:hypothetical protein
MMSITIFCAHTFCRVPYYATLFFVAFRIMQRYFS